MELKTKGIMKMEEHGVKGRRLTSTCKLERIGVMISKINRPLSHNISNTTLVFVYADVVPTQSKECRAHAVR